MTYEENTRAAIQVGWFDEDEIFKTNLGTTFIEGGDVIVSWEGTDMVLEAVLTDEEGRLHHVTYKGPAVHKDRTDDDNLISDLTGDYTLDLKDPGAYASFYGDYFGYGTGGNNWFIEIWSETGVDEVQINLISVMGDFADGIPTGIYTAAASVDSPLPGEYIPGHWYDDTGDTAGTMYIENAGMFGTISAWAPAVAGTAEIVNKGDGTYDISFEFQCDRGHTWDGKWSGELELYDESKKDVSSCPFLPAAADRHIAKGRRGPAAR